jgi:hypothetical protein
MASSGRRRGAACRLQKGTAAGVRRADGRVETREGVRAASADQGGQSCEGFNVRGGWGVRSLTRERAGEEPFDIVPTARGPHAARAGRQSAPAASRLPGRGFFEMMNDECGMMNSGSPLPSIHHSSFIIHH